MMIRLIIFELTKIWGKRSFILSVCILLFVNLFLLLYVHLPNDETPLLSSYKAFENDISFMSEHEKADYITELKNKMEGIVFVQSIQDLQAMENDMGNALVKQKLDDNPGVFENYYELYKEGKYLLYTDNLSQESILINNLYDEFVKVSGYSEYLASVQENKNTLGGISIFKESSEDKFAGRNIEKSAADYKKLENVKICWQPSKGISVAMESRITDILMYLGLFLFVGGMITEEKEKGLFYITRATKCGMACSIISKLLALLIHCIGMVSIMMVANLIFTAITTGNGDLTASIQSLAPYMESSLSISVLQYIMLSILTKCIVLFCFGTLITCVAICSKKGFLPYLVGIGLLGISSILYLCIPSYSEFIPLKYTNFFGFMETEQLYGAYLNLNIGGNPVTRLALTVVVLVIIGMLAVIACICFFLQGNNLEITKEQFSFAIRFRPHNNLFRHEAYKLLITNRAIIILVCFTVLLGYYVSSQKYYMSAGEEYYQRIMFQLEGELDENKESIILSEQTRFNEAFSKIEKIETMVENGEIDSTTAEMVKLEWESVLSFYPSFQRVEQQYERVCRDGGEFIYDTGYLYLFGTMDDSFLIGLLLLSICMVLAFYNGISMEYSRKSWFLLRSTKSGYGKIIMRKSGVCLVCGGIMAIVPWIFRSICISSTFPMSGLQNPIQSISVFEHFGIKMSILSFVVIVIISQMFAVMVTGLLILGISAWRKNDIQALFFGLLLMVIPLVFKIMGFDAAGWFSVYPIYAWTGL